MLETVDFTLPDLDKPAYKQAHDALVERLVVLQQQARQQGVGLVVLFEGWNGAGKGSRLSDLMFNLDARATSVRVTPDLDEAAARSFPGAKHGVTGMAPFLREFWEALGPRSALTFFDRGWYTAALQQVLHGTARTRGDRLARARACLASIESFERQLTRDGYALVKVFFHMTEKGQRKRLEKLRRNPETRWRVSEAKLARIGNYEEAYAVYDLMLEESDFPFAPWVMVNGERKRRANLRIAEVLSRALEDALERKRQRDCEVPVIIHPRTRPAAVPAEGGPSRTFADGAGPARAASAFPLAENPPTLAGIDRSLSLPEDDYRHSLKRLQKRLFELGNRMYCARVPLVAMFEGWDAAGKGGAIKRVAQALDARSYRIVPSPAPTADERAHPHLWRYWTRLPKAGHVGLFDRSWYGRVLVERVEGFAAREEWERAYDEINAFERDLVDWGAILLKFWVDVSPEEQLRRFERRAADPARRWKITDEDWRNREKRPAYAEAVDEMFARTSTSFAPWTILESDDKRYARVKALRAIVEALECRLG